MGKTKQTLLLKYAAVVVACVVIYAIWPKGGKHDGAARDFDQIKSEGVLRAATEYNAVGYYVDGDTISGFHYALINAFAKSIGVKAEITPVMGFNERLEGLDDGTFDLIAYSTVATGPMRDSLLLSTPIILNKLVLVQRKAQSADDSMYVRSQIDLGGRTIHLVKGSPEALRIHNLENEIGDTIYIEEIEKYGPEQLIDMVAHGDIDYTVCDATIARGLAGSIDNIDVKTDIGFTQFYSWAASKRSPALIDSLNAFLKRYCLTAEYKQLYKRYYSR
jgi:membrane-bound lytic murein transglycosylase MltF